MLRVFQRYGDYEHKQRNRLKFLVKSMGWEKWQAAFQVELDALRAAGGATLSFDAEHPPVEEAPTERADVPAVEEIATLVAATPVRGPGIVPVVDVRDGGPGRERSEWLRTNLQPQKQAEYSQVTVSLVLGDLTGGQMRALAALCRAYADGTVRVTVDQNLVMRWVRSGQVPGLYRRLAAAGLAQPGAGTITDVTSCPGAESCRLAVTQSRGLARLIGDDLQQETRTALTRAAADVRIKISGCPNGCGQHHVAAIGFQGSIRKIGDRAVPQYFMMLGGGAGPDGASFGRLTAKIPARRIPEAVTRMLELYREDRTAGETAAAFFLRVEPARARAAVADLEKMTAEDALAADFIDPGEDHAFSPEVMDGECSA